MTGRKTLDQMNSNDLDALYDQLDRLRAAILDIDAHATPIGLADPTDPDGNPHHYALTVGALHRALGKIGHTAAPCTAEAAIARVRALADRWDNALAPDRTYARALRAALNEPAPGPAATQATETTTTTRVFAALHRSAEQDVTRVIETVETGPPSGAAIEGEWENGWNAAMEAVRAALTPTADQTKEQ